MILNWICELTVVSFYLTHWRFETCFISAFSVIWISFYLTHWRFETITISSDKNSHKTNNVLPYSLEVWNCSSLSTTTLSSTCFTLLIGGLKHISHKQNPHSFIVLPYSLEVWNFLLCCHFLLCLFVLPYSLEVWNLCCSYNLLILRLMFYLTHQRIFNVIKYTNKVVKISVPIDNMKKTAY